MSAPAVSVVLGVRDGGDGLERSIASVLEQQGVDLELIVVDDGSRDGSGDRVEELAAGDRRIQLLRQGSSGLTAALALGCAAARGRFIARQDCGDRSLPGRLAILAGLLDSHPELVLVSGGTRFLGPRGEFLYEVAQTENMLREGLAARRFDALKGPSHHGCVMFRRRTYDAAGGYRREFVVAQDLDLWLRMAELGLVSAVPTILYEATIGLGSISALSRDRQVAASRIALGAALRRRSGESDADELALAAESTGRDVPRSRWRRARAAYFLASCLRGRDRDSARAYLAMAIRSNPLHLKAWVRWLDTL